MGSILTLEIPSLSILIAPQVESQPMVSWPLVAFIIFLILAGLAIAFYFRFRKNRNNNHRRRNHSILPLNLLVILLVASHFIPIIEGRPRKLVPIAKKLGKSVSKTAVPLLASTAFYFGLESLGQFSIDNPEFSTSILAVIGCFFTILALFLLKLATTIHRLFFLRANPANEGTELAEINNTLTELVQRAPPPPTSF